MYALELSRSCIVPPLPIASPVILNSPVGMFNASTASQNASIEPRSIFISSTTVAVLPTFWITKAQSGLMLKSTLINVGKCALCVALSSMCFSSLHAYKNGLATSSSTSQSPSTKRAYWIGGNSFNASKYSGAMCGLSVMRLGMYAQRSGNVFSR